MWLKIIQTVGGILVGIALGLFIGWVLIEAVR